MVKGTPDKNISINSCIKKLHNRFVKKFEILKRYVKTIFI